MVRRGQAKLGSQTSYHREYSPQTPRVKVALLTFFGAADEGKAIVRNVGRDVAKEKAKGWFSGLEQRE